MKTPYFLDLHYEIMSLGGYHNAHLHLDRAGTYHETVRMLDASKGIDGTALPLSGKHALIPMVHASDCYNSEKMIERIEPFISSMIASGTARADTVVDVTSDRVGLQALENFMHLKKQYSGKIDLRIGAYSPLGFRDDEPVRWDLIKQASEICDFIGLLPERDDQKLYPDHIGFSESCKRALILAHTLKKPVHIHVDQANHCYERASEIVVEVIDNLGLSWSKEAEPIVWLVHFISPSTYHEDRFQELISSLVRLNVGVIVCPSAAISMRQFRTFLSPTYNSIARALDLIAAGVHVRLGSDNVCDITSPMGTVDLLDEVKVFGDAMRYYNIKVLAQLAAGKKINANEIDGIKAHLSTDVKYAKEESLRYL
jgi:cytosine/creatinine deaminase